MSDTKIGRPVIARSTGGPLMVTLERGADTPLHRQIYLSIRESILACRLAPGTRLPASRVLADELAVSRTTVVLAYERLETEGYINGRGSAGSFVSELPLTHPGKRTAPKAVLDSASAERVRFATSLARTAEGIRNVRTAPVPFRLGEPALDLFPIRLWARIYARRARRSTGALLGYGDPAGHRPLRAAIAAYVSASRGVNATAEQVILTRGTQQSVHLAARVLLTRDDVVWVEDPGYLAARAIFRAVGAILQPVPVDEEGIIVTEGIARAPSARLAYVAPSHQFPLGAAMSLSRRIALLDWAARSGAWILEDDYDSEFRYAAAPLPSLQGLDSMERVIYLGTFSKTLFPALRLGYLIVPQALVDGFRATHAITDLLAPSIEHATLAEFIDAGHFARHVRLMRAAYASRQRALMRALARELDGLIEATAADSGMHVIGWLKNRSLDDVLVSRLAWDAGVEAAPLSRFTLERKLPPALLLGFAACRPAKMGAAMKVLRQAILDAK